MEEGFATVQQVVHPVLFLGRAERMHIEADEFAVLTIPIALQGAHLVEGAAKIGIAKRPVLIDISARSGHSGAATKVCRSSLRNRFRPRDQARPGSRERIRSSIRHASGSRVF